MATKADLAGWVIEALSALGGSGTVVSVSKCVWNAHSEELQLSGDLYFTWQYDIRWAAQKLRNEGILVKLNGDRSGVWSLSE